MSAGLDACLGRIAFAFSAGCAEFRQFQASVAHFSGVSVTFRGERSGGQQAEQDDDRHADRPFDPAER